MKSLKPPTPEPSVPVERAHPAGETGASSQGQGTSMGLGAPVAMAPDADLPNLGVSVGSVAPDSGVSTFTPGPWTANGRWIGSDQGLIGSAELNHLDPFANVRLMAAAPELLQATRDLLGMVSVNLESNPMWPGNLPDSTAQAKLKNARAIIARAGGPDLVQEHASPSSHGDNGTHTAALPEAEANARLTRLFTAAPELLQALKDLTVTARTFRNVPVEEQMWTGTDDEVLDAAFAVLEKVEGRKL